MDSNRSILINQCLYCKRIFEKKSELRAHQWRCPKAPGQRSARPGSSSAHGGQDFGYSSEEDEEGESEEEHPDIPRAVSEIPEQCEAQPNSPPPALQVDPDSPEHRPRKHAKMVRFVTPEDLSDEEFASKDDSDIEMVNEYFWEVTVFLSCYAAAIHQQHSYQQSPTHTPKTIQRSHWAAIISPLDPCRRIQPKINSIPH